MKIDLWSRTTLKGRPSVICKCENSLLYYSVLQTFPLIFLFGIWYLHVSKKYQKDQLTLSKPTGKKAELVI